MTGKPVLAVRMPMLVEWEQDRPGGCRCLCGLFHRETARANGCVSAAEPGLLVRVETPDDSAGPLPVCAYCYSQLAHVVA
ncbi:DUF6372 family protein (plasmid) [Streptomyces sp. BR1]|uniref:DUF6372 family protein n=1 Tax=Streptomyces sp. BR1 TaxID=1592323 RepID=UPI00402B86EB